MVLELKREVEERQNLRVSRAGGEQSRHRQATDGGPARSVNGQRGRERGHSLSRLGLSDGP